MTLIQPPPSVPNDLDENTLNLLELVVYVEEGVGFQLGLATYDIPEKPATLTFVSWSKNLPTDPSI